MFGAHHAALIQKPHKDLRSMGANRDRDRKHIDDLKAYFVDVIKGNRPDQPAETPVPDAGTRKPNESPERRGRVTFDAKGNPVWNLKADYPGGDDLESTFDMLSPLEHGELAIEDAASEPPPDAHGKDPYNSGDD